MMLAIGSGKTGAPYPKVMGSNLGILHRGTYSSIFSINTPKKNHDEEKLASQQGQKFLILDENAAALLGFRGLRGSGTDPVKFFSLNLLSAQI